MEEKEFINEAIKKGLVSFEQIQECLKTQDEVSKAGLAVAVWEILVRKGFATQEQVDAILSGAAPGAKAYPFGPYLIQAKIGEGGMGAVYRATKKGDDKVVALKLLPQRFASNVEYVKRFEREARICIAISDPHLIKGYEFGQINGRWYYAMEFVKGKVLSTIIKEKKQVDDKSAMQVMIQIAQALDTIHKNGLVHRDVKPENIILSEEGVAKLMDLGLVKSTLSDLTQLTQSGFAVGTPHYMSPEQIQGTGAIDIRSDIYSLGATLYHAVTGAQPFKGSSAMEIINKQLRHELEDPRGYKPDLSDGVIHVTEKMMARDPKDRYQTPTALLEDLYLVLDGNQPKSTRLELGRSILRRRVGAPGAGKPLPAGRQSRRIVKDTAAAVRPSRKRSPMVLVGVAAGAATIVLLLIVLLVGTGHSGSQPGGGGANLGGNPTIPGGNPIAPPNPNPVVTPPKPNEAAIKAEKSVRDSIAAGSFTDASRLLNREAGILGTAKVTELAQILKAAAEQRVAIVEASARRKMNVGGIREARDELEACRREVGEVEGMNAKIDGLLAEIQKLERESKQREEADARFKSLEDQIVPFERAGKFEQAREVLKDERARAAANTFLTQLIDDRIRWLEDAIARRSGGPDPGPKPAPGPADPAVIEAVRQARKLFDQKEYDKAAMALNEVIKRDPEHAPAWALRAHCFLEKDIRPNAWADANKALTLDKTNARASYVIGRVVVKDNGKLEDATRMFTQAISGDPTFHPAYFARAELYSRTGNFEDALRDLIEAARLDPVSSTNPGYPMVRARIHEIRGETDKAIADCSDWIKIAPKDLEAWLKRADLNMDAGNFKEARDDYAEALKLDPKHELALQGRADALNAIKTGKRPDRDPPPGAKISPSDIRKKLLTHFNAGQEQVTLTRDGRFQATLVYDFSKQQQFDDFAADRSQWKGRLVEMLGSGQTPAGLVFKPLIRGDMLVRVEYTFVNDQTQSGNGVSLRTTSASAPGQSGDGIGCQLAHNGSEWVVKIATFGSNPQDVSGEKIVTFTTRDKLGFTLKREQNKFSGFFTPRLLAEALQPGYEPAYLRFEASDPVRVTRFEIQVVLDPDWVIDALGLPRDPGAQSSAMWNGKDLTEWDSTGRATVTMSSGELSMDSPDGVGVLIHKGVQQGKTAKYEMTVVIEESYDVPLVGFGLVINGNIVSSDGNIAARWGHVYSAGPGIRIDRFRAEQWDKLQIAPNNLPLAKGEFKLEMVVDGPDITLRVNGTTELKAVGALAGVPSFRLALMLQHVKARIKSVVKKP